MTRMRPMLLAALVVLASRSAPAADAPLASVGVAKVDITPTEPIRLSGYGFRRKPHEGMLHPIWAKALAIGADEQGPAVLLMVDATCIPEAVTDEVARRLAADANIRPEKLTLSYTHTHTAPMVRGGLDTLFGEAIPAEHQAVIDRYTAELIDKLTQVSHDALAARQPARLSWAEGEVDFAANRRTPGGPVDHRLPTLFVENEDGTLRAVVANYACHCTTLDDNLISGDWAGYAQIHIERAHPGAIGMVTIGCGADSNPAPRRTIELAEQHGRSVAAEVERLWKGERKPLGSEISAKRGRIQLAFDTLPSREAWEERAKQQDAVGYHARVQLARLDAGQPLPTELGYTLQTWSFGDDLTMVFLPGEVVVDYALRLKREFTATPLWMSAYCTDAPCYIPSRRIWEEGGYEGGGAMTYYDRPTRLAADTEERIFAGLKQLLPQTIVPAADGSLTLAASTCEIVGPTLQYMKEDDALGWWNSPGDACSWTIEVPQAGQYEVTMEWSCDASCAGNRFALEGSAGRLMAAVPSTGTWQDHETRTFGTLALSAGKQRLTVRADGPIQEALMDLRTLTLKLMNEEPR